MRLKGMCDEDFVNYKQPSMMLVSSYCNFKCDRENGINSCQNSSLAKAPIINIEEDTIIQRYLMNDITKAICIAGLEPFEQYDEVFCFIKTLREKYHCKDTVIIYTGFNKDEIESQVETLSKFENIVIKFGRYLPNQKRHFDKVLGVYLASDNQYAEVIS